MFPPRNRWRSADPSSLKQLARPVACAARVAGGHAAFGKSGGNGRAFILGKVMEQKVAHPRGEAHAALTSDGAQEGQHGKFITSRQHRIQDDETAVVREDEVPATVAVMGNVHRMCSSRRQGLIKRATFGSTSKSSTRILERNCQYRRLARSFVPHSGNAG